MIVVNRIKLFCNYIKDYGMNKRFCNTLLISNVYNILLDMLCKRCLRFQQFRIEMNAKSLHNVFKLYNKQNFYVVKYNNMQTQHSFSAKS